MTWAYSSGSVSTNHGRNYGTSQMIIDSSNTVILGGGSKSKLDFYYLKGFVLIFCWIFLNFVGVFAAVYLKHLTYWIHIHRICSGLAASITIILGIISIVDRKWFIYSENSKGRIPIGFNVAHRVLGIIIIILSFYQIIFGNIIYYFQTSESLKTRWIHSVKFGHKIGGIMTGLLCLVELSLGAIIRYPF